MDPQAPALVANSPIPTTTRAKNERETIRSTLIEFCDKHGLVEEKERIKKYSHSWELIKDCVKWYPKPGEALPVEFVKAVSFPVDQGSGQSGKGYRLLKHRLTGRRLNAATEKQLKVRDDINNWLRRLQGLPCRQDDLQNIGLEAQDRRVLRDIKSSWVRLAHHYREDYSDLLQAPVNSHFYDDSIHDDRKSMLIEEVTKLLKAAIQKIKDLQVNPAPYNANDAVQDSRVTHGTIVYGEPNDPRAAAAKRQRPTGMPALSPVDPSTLRNRYSMNIRMHHPTKDVLTDPNEIICDLGWENSAPKRRFYSRDFRFTPFEEDFRNLKSLDFICSDGKTSFGPSRASISPEKKIIEFTIPVPPENTESLRVPSFDVMKPLACCLECEVRLTSNDEKEEPVYVKSFTYFYPTSPLKQSSQEIAPVFPKEEQADEPMPDTNTDQTMPDGLGNVVDGYLNPWSDDEPGYNENNFQNFMGIDHVGVGRASVVLDIPPPLEPVPVAKDTVKSFREIDFGIEEDDEYLVSRDTPSKQPSNSTLTPNGMRLQADVEKLELHEYMLNNDIKNVKKWFESHKTYDDSMFFSEKYGRSLVDLISLKNYTPMLQFFLSLPKKPQINFIGRRNENALCSAIAFKHHEIASLLIDNAANVNLETPLAGGSAFLLAILTDNYEIVKKMIETNTVDWDKVASIQLEKEGNNPMSGFNAVHLAVLVRNTDLVELLLNNAPTFLKDKKCDQHITPLMYAVQMGEFAIVYELLKFNARLDTKTRDGRTVLDIAFGMRHMEDEIYDLLCCPPMQNVIVPNAVSLHADHLEAAYNRNGTPKGTVVLAT